MDQQTMGFVVLSGGDCIAMIADLESVRMTIGCGSCDLAQRIAPKMATSSAVTMEQSSGIRALSFSISEGTTCADAVRPLLAILDPSVQIFSFPACLTSRVIRVAVCNARRLDVAFFTFTARWG